MKFKLIITTLLIFLLPSLAMADVITSQIAVNMIDVTKRLSLHLFTEIAAAYSVLYVKIATIGFIIILTKFLFTRVVPVNIMISFMLSLTISSAIAFNPTIFKIVVHDTFFKALYNLDQFIVVSASNELSSIRGLGFNSLIGVFAAIDNSLMEISAFAFNSIKDTNLLATPLIFIQALVIFILYLMVGIYFLWVFTVSIFGIYMMMILMPITISLYPFQRFRQYLTNSIQGMFYYGLITVFASVAIAIVVFISNDLVTQSIQLKEEGADIPPSFFMGAIIVGLLSIQIIKMTPEFASRISNASSSQLGGAFAMIATGTAAVAKGAGMITGAGKSKTSSSNNTNSSSGNGAGTGTNNGRSSGAGAQRNWQSPRNPSTSKSK